MEFNPTVKKKITVVYPKLSEMFGSVDDKMARYILLMYDSNSPLRNYFPELQKRKEFSASIAGYDIDKDDVTPLFTFTRKVVEEAEDEDSEPKEYVEPHEELLHAISDFLIYQNNRLWVLISTNEQAFYECQVKVMTEVVSDQDKDALSAIKIKKELLVAMDEIHKRLQLYYRELSGDDKDLELEITKRRRTSAEAVAIR